MKEKKEREVGDGKKAAIERRKWKHIERVRRDVGAVGVGDLERQKKMCVCVYVYAHMEVLDRDMDSEISLPQLVCPLALFHSI